MSRVFEVEQHVERRMLKWPLFNLRSMAWVRVKLRMSAGNQGAAHLAMQGDWVTLWTMDNNQVGQRERSFLLAGTGHVLPHNMLDYFGTVHWEGLVLHVFEIFE